MKDRLPRSSKIGFDIQLYDQQQNEWVLELKGAARLAFEDGSEVNMGAGDCLEIVAHLKHRVVWTVPAAEAVWLGVFYG